VIVQHNILAMNANRNVKVNTGKISGNTKKLASGYRINSSADDAAGLVISEKMRKQIRGLSQGSNNSQDGISMVQTAEGALNEVHDMLQRMNELAIQAANETNSDSDRAALQLEFEFLQDEIDRISETTTFNEKLLFSSGIDEAEFDDVSALRGSFNSEILGKINKLESESEAIDSTGGAVTTFGLRNTLRNLDVNEISQVNESSDENQLSEINESLGINETSQTSESLVGNGIIDLSSLTGDLQITDTGYIVNGVEYSYTGSYTLSGTTSNKVNITRKESVTLTLADGTSIDGMVTVASSDVSVRVGGTANISNITVGSNGDFEIVKNGSVSSVVNANTVKNGGNLTINSGCTMNVEGNLTSSDWLYNYGILNVKGSLNNSLTFYSSGSMSVENDIINTGSLTAYGTVTINGNVTNNNSFGASGTVTIKGNVNNTSTFSTSSTATVEGNFTNTGTTNVTRNLTVKGEFANKDTLNINSSGNLNVNVLNNESNGDIIVNNNGKAIINNTLTNNGNIIIDGGGTLIPVADFKNNNSLRINTFGTLDGSTATIDYSSGTIKVEDHYNIKGNMVENNLQVLDTITINLSMLSDVTLTDSGFDASGRNESPYNNKEQNRTYVLKGDASHYSSINNLTIQSSNVNVIMDGSEKVYVKNLIVDNGTNLNITGPGKLIADELSETAPISNQYLYKYSNGNINVSTLTNTLNINSYGYKLDNDDTKYHVDSNTINLSGNNSLLDIKLNSNYKSINISNSSNCFVDEVTLLTRNVRITGNRLIANKVKNPEYIYDLDTYSQIYEIGDGNIDVNNLSNTNTLTLGDDYYKFSGSKLKYYNAGEYTFSGDNTNAVINMIDSNVINVDSDCKVGTVYFNKDKEIDIDVKGNGRIISNKVERGENEKIDNKIIILTGPQIDLSSVKDSLIITDFGYTKDSVNYEVASGEGVTLTGTTDKAIIIDSIRDVSLHNAKATGTFTVEQPNKVNVQIVGDTRVNNLVVEDGGGLAFYGDGVMHLTGEGFNMGNIILDEVEVIQEGIFNNSGTLVNENNIINEGVINNIEGATFNNKFNIENKGIINNLGEFNNEKEANIQNDKFIYNIGEFNNKVGATFDNNSVIENKYKLRNEGTLRNYEGTIENYYSVAGTILGNQPIYVYDGAKEVKSLDIQAGGEKEDKIGLDIWQMNSRILGIQKDRVNIRTSEDTTNAIVGISFALNKLSEQRSMLGAYQNRLEHTIRNLDNAVENTTSAESGIRDTDMAKEMVEYSNNNIVAQASQAMLAQANQLNGGVLNLLK